MTAVGQATATPRKTVRGVLPPLLRERVFRRYWGASTVSMFGDQVSSIAVPLTAVLVLHAGAAAMGVLTALAWLPSLLFGMHAGAWADRRGKRRQTMIAADLGRAVLMASVPVCYALHVLTLAQLSAVTFAAGTLAVLFNVSDSALFVSIVAPERYVDGQSLIYGSRALSFVGGPSAGGLLAQALTAPFAIAADALSFLGSAFFLGRIRPAEPPAADKADSVTAGFRFIARSPIVRASLSAVAVINLFDLMFLALFTLYAVRVLDVRPGALGSVDSLTVDEGTHLKDLISVAFALRQPETTTVPVANSNYLTSAGDAVLWDSAQARRLFRDLNTDRRVPKRLLTGSHLRG